MWISSKGKIHLLSKGAFVDSGKESSRFWRRIGLVHYAYQEVEGSSVCVDVDESGASCRFGSLAVPRASTLCSSAQRE